MARSCAKSDGKQWPEPGNGALPEPQEEMGKDESEHAVTPEGFRPRNRQDA